MKIASIIIILFTYTGVDGQSHKNFPPKWKKYLYDDKVTLTKINFHVNDTTFAYTLVQEPYGSLSFIEGHRFSEDTINFEYGVWHHLSKENRDTLIPNVVFNKNFHVLELNDLFSHFSLKHGGVLYTYDFDYKFYPYIKELEYSYVYYKTETIKLSEMDTDTIVRLTNLKLSPIETNQPKVTIYELTPGSKLKEIRKMNYSVDTVQNFILTKEEIIPLKKSEIKTLNNSFTYCLAEDIKYSTKTKQHNSFLIEIKLGNYYDTIERSDGLDGDMDNHYSAFQTFVQLVNKFGSLPSVKIEKRKEKYK